MSDAGSSISYRVRIGDLSRQQLRAALDELGVQRNASADVLLKSSIFDRQRLESFHVVLRTVQQIGVTGDATLSAVFARAREAGLSLCPPITGPYLRLTMADQTSTPDSVMSNGSAPSGSITIASPSLDRDDVVPKGFYLRAINGVLWLRGYHATDAHIWSPDDCFAFRT